MLGCYIADLILSKIEFFDCLSKEIKVYSKRYEGESSTRLEPNK
jgi:hypothetical protein